MTPGGDAKRSMGLLGATGVGVGAIVGGGILALSGVAYDAAGPSAIVAFTLNGLIAVLTALSFAEMASAFPESGGTYTFARKVLSVEAAFGVGWIVWFASIVAAVLYALGFAYFAVVALEALWSATRGAPPPWLTGRSMVLTLAIGATAFYALSLMRQGAGGAQWSTIGKLLVFAVLIAGGGWALSLRSGPDVRASLTPFFAGGAGGVLAAMGYTFVALQGFDLIAAVGGEVRRPEKTIPRAMLLSLAVALGVYIPLLFVIATVGVEPGASIVELSRRFPETVVAVAARSYLGTAGFWLVIVAAVLSMLSALHANLMAASRIARTMARDRTMPRQFAGLHPRRRTPVVAIVVSAVAIMVILVVIPNVAAAGATASLIFLICFALAHGMSILARRRAGDRPPPFRTPFFPLLPVVGGLACAGLVVFQGVVEPAAGVIAVVWLGLGVVLYLSFFARRARVVDAAAEATDPHLVRLRGRSPLVLVPVANPANAAAMVAVAQALAPPRRGRVLLLSVISAGGARASTSTDRLPGDPRPRLIAADCLLQQATMPTDGPHPEALITVAQDPWREITRVAREHRCESLLLGLTDLSDPSTTVHLQDALGAAACDVVILRAPPEWRVEEAKRVLVPLAGRGSHDRLRARLLSSLCRTAPRDVTYLRVVSADTPDEVCARTRRELAQLAVDEMPGTANVQVIRSDGIAEALTLQASGADLVVLGMKRLGRRHKLFGDVALRMARDTSGALLLISRRG